MAGMGKCGSLEEEVQSEVWFQTVQVKLEADKLKNDLQQSEKRQKQLRARHQELTSEAAEAATCRVKIDDLNQRLRFAQEQLASTTSQLHEVQRATLEAHRAEDPMTVILGAATGE
eukprot:symbB.v1.2.031250.t1/scaffold3605.1/size53397/4